MFSKKIQLFLLFFWLVLGAQTSFLSAESWNDVLSPLPVLSTANIQITEGVSYCHAGYGSQNTIFNIEGQTTFSDTLSNPYLPKFQPLLTTFLKAGCVIEKIFIDYFMIDDAVRFHDILQYQGRDYNTIKFMQEILTAGYAFTLEPNFFNLHLGLGYVQTFYKLGLYSTDHPANYESEEFSHSGFLLQTSLRYIFSHYFFVEWQIQRAITEKSVVLYTNQLGLNFFSRY